MSLDRHNPVQGDQNYLRAEQVCLDDRLVMTVDGLFEVNG